MSDSAPGRGEDVVAWAVRTGRILASGAPAWRNRLKTGTATEAGLKSLVAVPELPKLTAAARSAPTRVAPTRVAAGWSPARAPAVAAGRSDSHLLARNPLVVAVASSNPRAYADASARGPPPTLFAGGDLPPFTASGLDPNMLLQVAVERPARGRGSSEPAGGVSAHAGLLRARW